MQLRSRLVLLNFTLSSSQRRETEQNIIVVAVFRRALSGQAGPGPGRSPLSRNKTCFTAGIWQEKGQGRAGKGQEKGSASVQEKEGRRAGRQAVQEKGRRQGIVV